MQLSNIAIQYISLVKKGANGKQIIYKSATAKPTYESEIAIKKTDTEEGVIYGIVYSPDEVDTQGDFATADEIKKAAYNFMKSKSIDNVDIEHDFNNVDAFVAESWIVKSGDSIFPDEKEGSWAVAIKLESDELKELAKSGEITGLSMAGEATLTEVQKSEPIGNDKFKKFFEMLADVVDGFSIDFYSHISKSTNSDIDTQRAIGVVSSFIKSKDEQIERLSEENSTKKTRIEELEAKNKTLTTEVKKSKQNKPLHQKDTKKDNTKGIF